MNCCTGQYSSCRRSQVESGSTFARWRKTLWRENGISGEMEGRRKEGGLLLIPEAVTGLSEKELITVSSHFKKQREPT